MPTKKSFYKELAVATLNNPLRGERETVLLTLHYHDGWLWSFEAYKVRLSSAVLNKVFFFLTTSHTAIGVLCLPRMSRDLKNFQIGFEGQDSTSEVYFSTDDMSKLFFPPLRWH